MTHRDLTSLIGSRICHDLISPLGAIGNGVELLEMTGVGSGPEMQLISESVASANRRIKMFRIAYGAVSSDQKVSENDIKGSLSLGGDGHKTSISWHPKGDQLRCDIKLVFLIIQCIESSIPFGGEIDVVNTDGAWVVSAQSEKLKADPALWALIHSPDHPVDLGASNVQFALIAPELARQNREVLIDISDKSIVVRL